MSLNPGNNEIEIDCTIDNYRLVGATTIQLPSTDISKVRVAQYYVSKNKFFKAVLFASEDTEAHFYFNALYLRE